MVRKKRRPSGRAKRGVKVRARERERERGEIFVGSMKTSSWERSTSNSCDTCRKEERGRKQKRAQCSSDFEPVPAGPAGAAPNLMWSAPLIVIQQRSVKGVMTSLITKRKTRRRNKEQKKCELPKKRSAKEQQSERHRGRRKTCSSHQGIHNRKGIVRSIGARHSRPRPCPLQKKKENEMLSVSGNTHAMALLCALCC